MDTRPLSPFRTFFPSALTMFLIGWGGLALLFTLSLPTVWPRWVFFVLWDLALTGTALPVTWFMNLRFPGNPPAGDAVVLRQAIWVGVYGAILAWLQLGGSASLWITFGLAAGMAGMEFFIRIRERSRWVPPGTEIEADRSGIKAPAENDRPQ